MQGIRGASRFHHTSVRKTASLTVKLLIGALCCMVLVGIIFAAYLSPGGLESGPSTSSSLVQSSSTPFASFSAAFSAEAKEQHWDAAATEVENADMPDWSAEFWTPIDVEVSSSSTTSSDPLVTLCRLNYRDHWAAPHNSPMFRDLVIISSCKGRNRKRERMSVLLEEVKRFAGAPEGRVVSPTAFIFHESRVGSTLVANLLATDPWSLVFSESTPIANAIMHCEYCSKETKVKLFRDVLTLMGRSPFHKRLFVKFQSITTTKIDIALEAFPNTPWAFLFRNPVQTMMSHLDPAKGANIGGTPCLRSKRSPPEQVSSSLSEAGLTGQRASNEAWCAAHLKMLCQAALSAYGRYNSTSLGQRGLLINYDSLPGVVPKALFPLFGISAAASEHWIRRMNAESQLYSKNRADEDQPFHGDARDKESRATAEIRETADLLLQPIYETLNQLASDGYRRLKAATVTSFSSLNSTTHNSAVVDWMEVRRMPFNDEEEEERWDFYGHSKAIPAVNFEPWLPFATRHRSRPFERPPCPPLPSPGYPKEYRMMDILSNWNADSTEIPPFHYDSLCHFDYNNESQLRQAYEYRAREVPFVVYNVPEVDRVAKKWNNVDNVARMLGSKTYRTETSQSNHFMYWSGKGSPRSWSPPTKVVYRKFRDWLDVAVAGQNKSLEERDHQYFRVSSDMGNSWLYKELPFFQPQKSLFIVEPREQRGIHCRFGMRSVIAEAHFDGSRNFVAMLFGLRRWILTHPNQCKHMHMYMRPHPSARHSSVDWSHPDIEKFPNFPKVMGNEVILQPGDMLFVPTVWIHFIVSLNVNIQCNTRSGIYHGFDKDLRECGF
eukprot:gene4418-4839_t